MELGELGKELEAVELELVDKGLAEVFEVLIGYNSSVLELFVA